MDKRTGLALLLAALVIFAPMFLRSGAPRRATGPSVDSATSARAISKSPAVTPESVAPAQVANPRPIAQSPGVAHVETTTVGAGRGRFTFTSAGAAPLFVSLPGFRNLGIGAREDTARLMSASEPGVRTILPLLRFRLTRGADTIAFDSLSFRVVRTDNGVAFTSAGVPQVTIRYEFVPGGYLTHIRGDVAREPGDSARVGQLLVDLPPGLRSQEADPVEDARHLAYGYKILQDGVKSIAFSKLDPMLVQTDSGPMTWVSTRNKYFLVALLTPASPEGSPFAALRMQGGPRVDKLAPVAHATAVQPLRGRHFALDLYAGPQSWEQLRAAGHDLENVNPYGGWIPGVQPFATICMRILLWIKQTLNVSYGWVLVIFGIAVRLLLWPLNQSAMRSSLKMQRLQPELQEVQKRYKNDPEKQREALVKLYQQHGMSPLSPLMGCLPMLLPMPVLFALFFVFQNTIEFRGVPFFWLPDLSLKDPFYIMPIFMGISMFVLSWIAMRAAPPNPQTKMMSYMMPAVMTLVLLNFASGLNLYYAVQNLAALPQQWLLTRERMKSGPGASTGGTRGAARGNVTRSARAAAVER